MWWRSATSSTSFLTCGARKTPAPCARGYGAARIRQELSHRGISREDADAAMELFSPALPQMLSLLEKRLHGDLSDRKEVDKAVAALQRRGFSWSDIKNALEEYGASLDIDE